MKYELYADIWFVTNVTMDAIALWLSGKLTKQKIRCRRLLLAGLLGTTVSLVFFFCLHHYTCYLLLVHLLLNPAMVWLCFQSRKVKEFLAQWAVTYLAVVLLGGILQAGRNLFPAVSGCWLLAAGLCVLLAGEKAAGYLKGRKETVFRLLILTETGQFSAMGFYDTGNLLKDPLVNQPVHIMKGDLLKEQLAEEHLPVRLIPYHSLGTEAGLLEAVTLKGMYIFCGETARYLEKPVFGIAREELFQSREYDVILNGTCMEH